MVSSRDKTIAAVTVSVTTCSRAPQCRCQHRTDLVPSHGPHRNPSLLTTISVLFCTPPHPYTLKMLSVFRSYHAAESRGSGFPYTADALARRNLGGTNGGSTSNTTTMLFGFLIVFIVLFVAFVLGGLVLHRIRRRNRLAGQIMLTYDENRGVNPSCS